jgi:hypothetical protein
MKKRFIKFSIYFFIVCGVILLIAPIQWFPQFYDVRYMGAAAFVCAAAIVFLPRALRVNPDAPSAEKKNQAADFFQFGLALAVMNNALGDMGLYQLYKVGIEYDKIIHFVTSVLAVVIIAIVLCDRFEMPGKKAFLISFLVVIFTGVLWEGFEFLSDAVFKTHIYGVYGADAFNDTVRDLICNVFGSLTGAFIMVFRKREKLV